MQLKSLLFPLALALVMVVPSSAQAQRGHRGLSKTSYKSAKEAALHIGASNMNRTPPVKKKMGTMTVTRLTDKGVVSKSSTGVTEKHLVQTRKKDGAKVEVSVRRMADGTYKGYHNKGSAKVTQNAGTSSRRAMGAESSSRRRSGAESSSRRRTGAEYATSRQSQRRRSGAESSRRRQRRSTGAESRRRTGGE